MLCGSFHCFCFLTACHGLAVAEPITFTIAGTANGSFNATPDGLDLGQPFNNLTFSFGLTTDTTLIQLVGTTPLTPLTDNVSVSVGANSGVFTFPTALAGERFFIQFPVNTILDLDSPALSSYGLTTPKRIYVE
jgi:hypothetical protein